MANRLNIDVYKNPPVKTKYFPAFDGVDLSSDYTSVSENNSPYMINMFRDYSNGGVLRTRPRMKREFDSFFSGNVIAYNDNIYLRESNGLFSRYKEDGSPAYIYLNNIDNEIPFASSSDNYVVYHNKIYFYENNRDGVGDVFIYDGSLLTRFTDILAAYTAGFESSEYYYTSTFKFPINYNDHTKRYTLSDYTLADAMAADLYVAKKTTLSDEQMQRYDFKNPDSTIASTVVLSDAMIIHQIVAGRINQTKQYFTQDDIELVEKYLSNTIEFSEEQKRKYNVTQDNETVNGVIVDKVDADDLNAIKGYVSARQLSLTKLPLEIAPITYINANKYGAGEAYERINLLSPYFIVQYLGDGVATEFALPLETAMAKRWQAEAVNTEQATSTLLTGQNAGTVKLASAPANGSKFYVLCKMADAEYDFNRNIVGQMNLAQIFDNRVFMAGATGEYLNRVIHSGIDNLLYFPDNAFYEDIMGQGQITALLPVKSQLAVIKKDTDQKNAIYLHTPTATENDLAPKKYPSTYGLLENGCVNFKCFTVFNGEALFLSKKGLMAITSTDLSDERSVQPRSTNVFGNKVINDDAYMWQDNDYLYIQNGANDPLVYVANSHIRTYNKQTQSYEYEWFVWDGIYSNTYYYIEGTMTRSIPTSFVTLNNKTYTVMPYLDINVPMSRLCSFTTELENGKYNDTVGCSLYEGSTTYERPVYSILSTPLYNYGYPQYYKSCFRKGCIANVEGSNIMVYTKTDASVFNKVVFDSFNEGSDLLWKFPETGYNEVLNISQYGTHLIFRPSDRRWLNISYVFYSPDKPMTFYDVTTQAQINNTVNNI